MLLESSEQDALNAQLLDAVNSGRADEVESLLDRGADIEARNLLGCTPIYLAVRNGDIVMAELLIDRGANVDTTSNLNNRTPIMDAATYGKTDFVRLLIKGGADVNAGGDDNRDLPIHSASINGHKEVVRLLIDGGARVDATNSFGKTALGNAVDRFYISSKSGANTKDLVETAKILILGGADPLKAFDGPEKVIEFFKGDLDWMPDGPLKEKLKRMAKGKQAFGM